MNSIRHFPLGESFPSSPHAVASSLPTMADVCAYEEHDERVTKVLESGYPRFVVHRFVKRLLELFYGRFKLLGRYGLLIPSRRAAHDLLGWCKDEGVVCLEVERDLYMVHCEAIDTALAERIRKYVQHVGCGISSRQAEDLLFKSGLLPGVFEEEVFSGNANQYVEVELAKLCGCSLRDILICASGMNAFYAGFSAALEFQRQRGRSHWIQLGWLYLDSGCILKEFLDGDEVLEICYDAADTDALIQKLDEIGDDLAVVVVECPTNPLVQVPDLITISQRVREQGGLLLVDPTIASVYNVDVLPFADILMTSLTKYVSNEGDVMMGALAVNPKSPHYGDLVLRTSRFHVPPYCRDLSRLALELNEAADVSVQINENARELVSFLEAHSMVKQVYYPEKSKYFDSMKKAGGGGGAIISVELNQSLQEFYDTIEILKAPSFGTRFTFLCPFMYLAHYDLVTSEAGREFLFEIGIDSDLIRISVGTEPLAELKRAFDLALGGVNV